jgi:2-C-methyl-D-erythritol 2,4-cyclodiphosphate synthase
MLGALGQGDIGQLFPTPIRDGRMRPAASSSKKRCAAFVRPATGWAIVDITLLLEKPKIGPLRQQMLDSLRSLLGGAAIVNLKAGTNEGCDAIGRGEAVAAHAVVLLAAAT